VVTVVLTACAFTGASWIPGAKAVHAALWFWAGVSKLNHQFPAVVCVMTSNSPVTRFAWIRRLMYRDFPNGLRPSRLAELAAHFGTALELSLPVASLQAQCDFEEGELRCIMVESQPLFRGTLAYRILDARTGLLEAGELAISDLRARQPWDEGPIASTASAAAA